MCVGLDARIDFQNGLDGMLLSHFTEDFLRARILGDLGALENRYWGQRGSGNSTTRSQSDDATSKRKGGAAFPRLLSGCHWIPFWTRFW